MKQDVKNKPEVQEGDIKTAIKGLLIVVGILFGVPFVILLFSFLMILLNLPSYRS